MAAERGGLTPGANEVYDFTIPPAQGGQIEVGNLGVIDFVIGVNSAGQLHHQLRGMAAGTAISGVTIGDDGQLRLST